MGRGKRNRRGPKKVEKKARDPEAMFVRKPWLRPEPAIFVSRFMWDAKKPNWTYAVEELVHPVTHVVLNYHSRFPPCARQIDCTRVMQSAQVYQCQLFRYQDLAYNWYIGGDGHAYEGRGWKKHPKQQHELSAECLEIAYMGDYPFTYDPTPRMVEVFHELVNYGIQKKYIKEDYQLHELRANVQNIKRYL